MIKLRNSYEPSKITKYLPVQQDQLNYDLKRLAADLFITHFGCNLLQQVYEQHISNRFRVLELDRGGEVITVNGLLRSSWTKSGRWQYQTSYSLHLFANKPGMTASYTCVFNARLDTVLVIPLDVIQKSPLIEKTFVDKEKGQEVTDLFRDIDFTLNKDLVKLYTKISERSRWQELTL